MKFSELMNLPFDPDTGTVDMVALGRALPDAPLDVREQVLADHGRNPDFQEQYGQIDLTLLLRWQRLELPAVEIIRCTVSRRFSAWFNSVAQRATSFANEGWACIDVRPEVVAHWERHRT